MNSSPTPLSGRSAGVPDRLPAASRTRGLSSNGMPRRVRRFVLLKAAPAPSVRGPVLRMWEWNGHFRLESPSVA